MTDNFYTALKFILDHEGREAENVPGDPGGLTVDGITHIDYDAYRKHKGLPPQSVTRMATTEEYEIYHDHYAKAIRFYDLPYVVGLPLFDTAVNIGIVGAIRMLQRIVGVADDGQFGPATLNAVNSYVSQFSALALGRAIIDRRIAYYHSIVESHSPLSKFLQGWLNRCADLKKAIQE